ncbi:GntR family transcriptional regulator [Lederbergia citrea]|uniref:GntR family transcriptional regulator n=1 Tax=Lederbergia citrea TaxID=2833581 RepID=A0A942UMQ4_9BACI|nr:GntR family transcriptional regulator [Lederbergia citrea]MBS4177966.1 GntR family transcriptional regulator [Lederbergia citrea]MBS4223520.1 GntR family transcriptional regulator [Lederbergia citrea]
MDRKLDHESIVPLYHQLKELLRETIEKGVSKPGDKIPSEKDLCAQFNISRSTAKKAIEDLVQEGVLNRIQGKGTFIAKPKLEQSLSGFYSFSKVMQEKGLNPRDIILDMKIVEATPKVTRKLKLKPDEEVIELKRLRCANNEPIIFETSYIPEKIVPKISPESILENSLYDVMFKEFGIIVAKAKEVFEPILIQEYERKYLEVKEGYPALLLERIAYDTYENPVEYCHSIVRGDRCRFYTELI